MLERGLVSRVEDWLNKQGYPLEYRTYAALYKRFAANSGLGMHVQGEQGEAREIDVYAQATHIELTEARAFQVRIVCECKYSKAKPWVLLHGNADPTWLVSDWLHTPRTNPLHELPKLDDELADELRQTVHFAEGLALAHKIVQAHSPD